LKQPNRNLSRDFASHSHAAILDAVYKLSLEKPAPDLTMEAVAKRAGVGKPTLYKWCPSKASLIMTMFHERLVGKLKAPVTATAEERLRTKMRRLIARSTGCSGRSWPT
jgi:AcrR family transcriptional regulator